MTTRIIIDLYRSGCQESETKEDEIGTEIKPLRIPAPSWRFSKGESYGAAVDPPCSARQPGKWPVESTVEMIEGMSLQERNAAASDALWRAGIYGTSAASVSETY